MGRVVHLVVSFSLDRLRKHERPEKLDGVPGDLRMYFTGASPGDRAPLLRGFQSVDGAAYVQEWRCVLE